MIQTPPAGTLLFAPLTTKGLNAHRDDLDQDAGIQLAVAADPFDEYDLAELGKLRDQHALYAAATRQRAGGRY